MTLRLSSPAFEPGGRIPRQYTGEGPDLSPPLAWSGVPAGTRELALLCDDPDAPTPKPWVHWVLFGLEPTLDGLAEGDDGGGVSGATDFGRTGWGGPMPPRGHGVHRYHFRLFALDARLKLPPAPTKEQLLAAVKGHVLAEAELVGTYERK